MRAITTIGLARLGLRAAVLGGLLAAAQPASARDGVNAAILGGVAGGVLGGVAAGALMNQPPPPPPPRARPIYVEEEPEPIYVRPRRQPVCHFERRKVWLDDVEFTYKRVEVCE